MYIPVQEKSNYMSDGLNEMFSEKEVQDVVNQEGLNVVGDIFKFYSEAIQIAVEWIWEHEQNNDKYTRKQIREIISSHVKGVDWSKIESQLAAISSFQGNEED